MNQPADRFSSRDISVVIPLYNEVGSIDELTHRLLDVLPSLGSWEILFVNDGSSDGSEARLNHWCAAHSDRIRALHLRRNMGKSVALELGFSHARGHTIVMMDADLQDQPEEIPKLLNHMKTHALDVVTGWKRQRHDPLSKTIPSRLFNRVVRGFSGVQAHDFNCGLKAMRRECVGKLRLYGQLHRYMLILLAHQGFRIGEVPVEHAPRRHGASKYGHRRMFAGLMDLLTVYFLTRFIQSPLYFFGFYGLLFFILALIWGGFFIAMHFISVFMDFQAGYLEHHPLWMLSGVFLIVSLVLFSFGLIAEMILHLTSAHDYSGFITRQDGFSTGDDDHAPP